MATYSLGRSKYDSARSGERECEEWSGHVSHDTGMVWLRAVDHCDDWVVGDDFEYQFARSVDG